MTKYALALMLLVVGCGNSEPQPSNIQGTATFAGKPIVYGQLQLIPDASKQMSGPAGEAEIIDGKFDTSLSGRGVFLGPYEIRVTAWEERPAPSSTDETAVSQAKAPLFHGYTVKQVITAEGNVIDVPEAAKGYGVSETKGAKGAKPSAP